MTENTQSPEAGLTAADVDKLLTKAREEGKADISMSTFYRLVRQGVIRKSLPGNRVQDARYDEFQVLDLIENGTPSKKKRRVKIEGQLQRKQSFSAQVAKEHSQAASDWIQEGDLPFVWALDIELYGIENSVSPTITWTWWQKNPHACRILFNKENRREIWGTLSVIPMHEETIYKLLSGEMQESEITDDDVLAYEPGGRYTCYVASVAIHPEHRQSFTMLLHNVMSFWCEQYPEVQIVKLYAFALHDEEGTGLRLIRKLFFAPRYDIEANGNAYELRLDAYSPSPTIQYLQKCFQQRAKGKGRTRSYFPLVDHSIISAIDIQSVHGIVASVRYETARKEDITQCVAIDEAIFGPSPATPIAEQVATRQSWWIRNHEIFHVLKSGDKVVGYASTLPLAESQILKILHEQEHPRDIRGKDIRLFQPGQSLDIYFVVMGIDPAFSTHQKRLLGGKLIERLTETFRDWGLRGIEIQNLYARSRLAEGIKILEHIGFRETDFSPVNGKKIYFLNLQESSSSFALVYKKALGEYHESNVTN